MDSTDKGWPYPVDRWGVLSGDRSADGQRMRLLNIDQRLESGEIDVGDALDEAKLILGEEVVDAILAILKWTKQPKAGHPAAGMPAEVLEAIEKAKQEVSGG